MPVFCESALLNTTIRSDCIEERQVMRDIVAVIRSWPLRAPASTDPALRRRVRRGVLQGEQLHALARHVHYGKRGHADGRDFQQQMSRASCLVLILAAIIYWQILEIDSVLRHWDPAAFG
jgi:Tn3 transposase DDE domain